ncbi:hypothetical protein SESBI_20935 [Sesbania bispinosa]|nr:hypothetical protein SESBI_20935 [Sesbania bispinosa]
MGGGNSRLNGPEGEVEPSKIRTTLIGKFEEFKKRKNGEPTLSKKQLLTDAAEEEDVNSLTSHETETQDKDKVLPKEVEPTNKEESFVRVITTEKLSRVVPMPNSESETKVNIEEKVHPNQEKVIHADDRVVKTEEENTAEPLEEPKPENEQEVDKSPSPTIAKHQKSRSADSVDSSASKTTTNSNEVVEIESTPKKRGNKMKKFGAVRTLLKVKSCYHPMCTCAGEDRGQLVAAKAAN